MGILELYQQIVDEIRQNAKLHKGRTIGKSSSYRPTETIVLGEYDSKIINGRVYIALKQGDFDSQYRVIEELSIIRAIAKQYPELIPQLPLFLGLLVNGDGSEAGVITEDFSQGGKYPVIDGKYDQRIMAADGKIKELLKVNEIFFPGSEGIDVDVLQMCFSINGQIRFGDFDTLRFFVKKEESLQGERFCMSDLEKAIEKYTIRINYTI